MSFKSLSERILANAKELDQFIESRGSLVHSFENSTFFQARKSQTFRQAPVFFESHCAVTHCGTLDALSDAPPKINALREQLVDDATTIKALSQDPDTYLWSGMSSWAVPLVFQFLNEYKIANAIPLHGNTTYMDLAAKTGLDLSLVRRHMRFAISMHVFDENEDGSVKHTYFSRLMATNAFVSDAINFHTKELAVAATRYVDSITQYGASQEPNETAANVAFSTNKHLWEYTKYAAGTMQFAMSGDSWKISHILDAFDWQTIDKEGAFAIDLGGGFGHVSEFLTTRTKHLRFLVQDLPNVVNEAQKARENIPNERLQFSAHDFFEPQTIPETPDLIFTRFILHDWSDKYAARILKALVPIMSSQTKILIFEAVLPERPIRAESRRILVEQDIIMHVLGNGRERSASDFKDLLAVADNRFVLEAVNDPPASMLKGVVVGWKEDA